MLSAINIAKNKIEFSSYRFISPKDFHRENQRTRVQPGDVLLTIVGAIGRAAVVPEGITPFTLQRSVAVLTPNGLDSKFLMYQLESPRLARFFKSNARGTAQKGVYLGTLGSAAIWFPSVSEQRRIVRKIEELFSELDKGVESLETARQQLYVYRQVVLKRAFEGELTAQWRDQNSDKLLSPEELLSRIKKERELLYQEQLDKWKADLKAWEAGEKGTRPVRPPRPSWPKRTLMGGLTRLPSSWTYIPFEALTYSVRNGISQKPSADGTLKIFRISAVRPMKFDLSDYRMLPDDEQFERYKLERGDLVFTRYNGSRSYVGVAALYRGDGSHVYPDKLIRCQIRSDLLNAGYLEKAVNCGESRAFIERRIRTTAGQAGISGADLKAMPVPICSPEEQVEMSKILEITLGRIERLECEVDTALLKSRTLRESILEKAFAGQLVAQDPNDEPASALLERIRAGHEEEPSIRRNRSRKDAA